MSSLKHRPTVDDRVAVETAADQRRQADALAMAAQGAALDVNDRERAFDELTFDLSGLGPPVRAQGSVGGGVPHMHNPTPDIASALSDAYHWITD